MVNSILDSFADVNDGKVSLKSNGPSPSPCFNYPLANDTFETFSISYALWSHCGLYHPECSTKGDAVISRVLNNFTFN
jgi:hypothetical protein